MKGFFLLVVIIGYQSFTHSDINCKNPSGLGVDWFILYKLPTSSSSGTYGTEFFYMDNEWKKFHITRFRDITQEEANPLFKTLKPLYVNSPRVQSYAMYNDQPPPNRTAAQNKAHSKGALAFDKKTGFWMISSIPRFPAKVSDGYHFSDQQKRFGQIVLCVTVPLSVKEEIENIFSTTNPYIYDKKNFAVNGGNPPSASTTLLGTSEKKLLIVFAKSATFGKDIYADFISPILEDEIHVQTWHPNLKNYIGKALDIPYVDFGKGLSFKTGLDHSKWAVAKHQPYTCIGDLNRQETQFIRGGLSVCLEDKDVAKEFRNLLNIKKKIFPKNTCSEEKAFRKTKKFKLKKRTNLV